MRPIGAFAEPGHLSNVRRKVIGRVVPFSGLGGMDNKCDTKDSERGEEMNQSFFHGIVPLGLFSAPPRASFSSSARTGHQQNPVCKSFLRSPRRTGFLAHPE